MESLLICIKIFCIFKKSIEIILMKVYFFYVLLMILLKDLELFLVFFEELLF